MSKMRGREYEMTYAAFSTRLHELFIDDDKSLALQETLPYISGASKLMAKASFNFPLTAKANSQARSECFQIL